MRVAFFAGHAKSILLFNKELVLSMVSRGHDVVCIAPEGEYKEQLEGLGAKFIQVNFVRKSTNPISGIKNIKKFKSILQEGKFDIYYGFTTVPSTYGVIAAKRAKIKHIFVGVTGAGNIVQSRKGLSNKFIRIVLNVLYKYCMQFCEKVFFLNDDNINYFVKHKFVKDDQWVKTGGSGVNLERFAPAPLPEKNSFLYIGSLLKFKGIYEYMEAARIVKKIYPDAEFHIVGEIDGRVSAIKREELDEYINDCSVIYHGYQNDVIPFIKDCRCFVLPSYSEGVPESVLEAMSMARPIITTIAPGCTETVVDGENGLLTPIGDAKLLSEKIIYMIENPHKIKKMGEFSRKMAEDKFDVRKVNKAMMEAMNL